MMSFSEIETVSKRASKATGFSWGISEEIGKSVRILEMFCLPGISTLNQYLKKIKNKHPKKLKNITRGVLVKFPKKKQDYRVDLPTIGLNTLKQCKASGIKGIVLKHKRNIFLNKKKSIKYANKNKMFILVK